MALLIGTDEAGYGPNLGPLVVGATIWQVPDDWHPDGMYESLADVISAQANDDDCLVLADSKTLYQPGKGVGELETQVLAALGVAGISLAHWRDAWQRVAPAADGSVADVPWHRDFNMPLPMQSSSERIAHITANTSRKLRERTTAIGRIRATALFPRPFNDLVGKFGNKAAVLSHITIELVREMLESYRRQPVLIHCDKHGGRNHYFALLQHFFPDTLIQIVEEGRSQSIYRWSDSGRKVEIRFVAKGERFPPAALASMVAKYLRELSMHAFNEYWRQRVPDIRPTAGYPVDARRFKEQIAAAQRKLRIDDHDLWRVR